MSKLILAATPAALLFTLISGCSESGDGKSSSKSDAFDRPEGLSSALENPIIDCQTAAADCVVNASDLDARIACNDTLAQCQQDAATKAQNIAQQVEACRADGRVCLRNGTDHETCRDNYEACAQAALNGGGASADAGTASDDAGSSTDLPSLDGGVSLPGHPGQGSPGLPGLPGLGLGGVDAGSALDNLPEPVKCTIELRLCIAIDPISAGQCADDARICLQLP
jgi:hypothetical protein